MNLNNDEPLMAGVRVLDLGQGLAAPYCTAILRQQGAEVIKVEPPHGDWARKMGVARNGATAVTLTYNAGKSGLCVDAAQPAGQEVIARIARHVDVVVQNFRAGVVDRLNIGYESLSRDHPGLIYASISGFGSDGPLAHLAATDSVLQAIGGMMHANRDEEDRPRKIGLHIADIVTAVHAAQMICAALFRRGLTGRGRHLQLSLLEASCAMQASNFTDHVFSGGVPAPRNPSAPNGVFPVADGFLNIATLDDEMFGRLCGALGLAAAAADPRFATPQARLSNAAAINEVVRTRLAAETLESCARLLKDADILFAPVLDYETVLSHPQVRALGLFTPMSNPGLADLPLARVPGAGPATAMSAPAVGQHTTQLLERFGFGAPEIRRLLAAGTVVQGSAGTSQDAS